MSPGRLPIRAIRVTGASSDRPSSPPGGTKVRETDTGRWFLWSSVMDQWNDYTPTEQELADAREQDSLLLPAWNSHTQSGGGYITPTFQRQDGMVVISDPPDLAGRQVVQVIADGCWTATPGGVCGLVRNHRGEHWDCSHELIHTIAGPFAVVAVWP